MALDRIAYWDQETEPIREVWEDYLIGLVMRLNLQVQDSAYKGILQWDEDSQRFCVLFPDGSERYDGEGPEVRTIELYSDEEHVDVITRELREEMKQLADSYFSEIVNHFKMTRENIQ